MNVSVVVPSFNERDRLRLCLYSLAHCRVGPGWSVQVVVVDDGSGDGTGEMVAGLDVPLDIDYLHLPRGPRSGRSAARNAGIRRATGDLIVMVDGDQVVRPDFLAEHVRYHEASPDLVVVGRRTNLADEPVAPAVLRAGFDPADLPPVVHEDSRERVYQSFSYNLNNLSTCWHHLFTCNVSVRRKHLLDAGGLAEDFVGWGLEDVELGYRLRRRGLFFAYNRDAVLFHFGRRVVTDRMFQEWRANLRRFTAEHPEPQVHLQSLIEQVYQPYEGSVSWLEVMKRFEYAARALDGRLPRIVDFTTVEVHDHTLHQALSGFAQRAAETDLMVLDHTTGARMGPVVQTTNTSRELLYFPETGTGRNR